MTTRTKKKQTTRTQAIPVTHVVGQQYHRLMSEVFDWYADDMKELVNIILSDICADYDGGALEFYKITSNVGYFVPTVPETLRIKCNQFRGEMSVDAAGLIATLFAVGQVGNMTSCRAHMQHCIDLYGRLHAFICRHPERGALLKTMG